MDASDVRAVIDELAKDTELVCTVDLVRRAGDEAVVHAQLAAPGNSNPFALTGSEAAAGIFRGLRDRMDGEPWWVVADMAGEGLLGFAAADPVVIRAQAENVEPRSLYADAEASEDVFSLTSGRLPAPRSPRPSPFVPGSVPDDDWGFSFTVIPDEANWWVVADLAVQVGNAIEPAEHAAVARDWSHRFGAELVEYTGRSVTFALPEPIADEDRAKQVALEHLGYGGPDVVTNTRGFWSLDELAADLMVSTVWPFWWD